MYIVQRNLSGTHGLGLITEAAGFLPKILNIFGGESAAYLKRKTASDQHHAILIQFRQLLADPSTPAFILPQLEMLNRLHSPWVDDPNIAPDYKLNRIKGDVGFLETILKQGYYDIPARLSRSGRVEVYNATDFPAVSAVVPRETVAPVSPVTPGKAAPYVRDLPAPVTASMPGADMFGKDIFGIPMPIALGAAALGLYFLTKKR